MNKIWILTWNTESGDEGIIGYWTNKPSDKQVKKLITERFPEDVEAGYFYYQLRSLTNLTQ